MVENLLNNKTEYKKSEFVFDLVIGFTALVLVVFLFFTSTFWISTVCVQQTSMTNTLQDGDVLILDKLAKVDRGDVIVFKQNDTEDYIKRVIAIEGDSIYTENGEVFIERYENGELVTQKLNEPYLKNAGAGTYLNYFNYVDIPKVTLGKNEYFVLGDNRENSTDSRTFFNSDGTFNDKTNDRNYVGIVQKSQIIGVVHSYWIERKDLTTKVFG